MAENSETSTMLADGSISVEEATKFAGVGRSELYLRMEKGELPYVKIGRRRLIPRRALVAMLESNLVMRPA